MNKKQIINAKQNQAELLEGVKILYDAVSSTLGPGGKNVVIENDDNDIHITKDGVTVAKSISVEDSIHDLSIKLIKQAAQNVNDVAGDGTTTSTVLAYHLLKEGITYSKLDTSHNPIEIQRGINKGVQYVVNQLDEKKIDINDEKMIKQVALVSSNNDEKIATLLSEAIDEVGRDGIITVEDSNTLEDELEIVSGLKFNRGYASHYFVTDQNNQETVLNNPYILLYNGRLSFAKQITPVLEQLVGQNKSLLIIAKDIEGEALATLIINKIRGNMSVSACKADSFGDKQKEFLQDISVLTNAKIIDPEAGDNIEDFNDTSLLGKAKKVKMTIDDTTIIDGIGDKENIKLQAESIKHKIKDTKNDYAKKQLQTRLAKLLNGVAIIRIAAETELELNERKDRLEDSLNATKAAVEEGILPGGGTALYKIGQVDINTLDEYNKLSEGQKIGFKILMNSLSTPWVKIIENTNLIHQIASEKILSKDFNYGLDVRTNKYGDLLKMGIIDPNKVVKTALQKAASISGIFLTAETFVLNIPKEETDTLPNY